MTFINFELQHSYSEEDHQALVCFRIQCSCSERKVNITIKKDFNTEFSFKKISKYLVIFLTSNKYLVMEILLKVEKVIPLAQMRLYVFFGFYYLF